MLKINTVSPFHHSQYEFITENSVDIKDEYIQNAERIINRAENQIKLNEILLDIDKALKIELSIFEFSLIYCLNNNLNDNFIKAVYEDKLNSIDYVEEMLDELIAKKDNEHADDELKRIMERCKVPNDTKKSWWNLF
jgi:hypothetical protein